MSEDESKSFYKSTSPVIIENPVDPSRTCWLCNKFQPLNPETSKSGFCRAHPNQRHSSDSYDEIVDIRIYQATTNTCGEWQRNSNPLPAPPEGSNPPLPTFKVEKTPEKPPTKPKSKRTTTKNK